MMVRTRMRVAVLTLAAGALTAAPAVSQDPAGAEREAFAAIARAGEAIARAPDGTALWRAAEQAVTAAEQAAGAFTAADGARDAALAAYRAAYREALAGAVTCANGYPCTGGRIDPFDGFAAAFAAHFELLAAVSAANAAYVDAAGVPAAGEARARAARIRGLAVRMRDLGAIDDPRRWNALVAGAGAEIAAGNLLHRRATEARHAADLALVDDVTRVVEALHLAGTRVVQRSRPATDGPAADAGRAPAAGARDAAGTVSDAVLRAALDTAQAAMESLRSRIVAAATSGPDVRPTRAAETGAAGASEEPVPAGNAAPDRSAETAGAETAAPRQRRRPRQRRHCGRGARTGRRLRRLGTFADRSRPRGGAGCHGCRGRGGRRGKRAGSRRVVPRRGGARDRGGNPCQQPDHRRRPAPIRSRPHRAGDLQRPVPSAGRRAAARAGRLQVHRTLIAWAAPGAG